MVLRAFRKRHNAFNRRLSGYSLVPALAFVERTGMWHLSSVPKRTRGPVIKMPLPSDAGLVRVSEATAICALARLATRRELRKVRLCAQCGDNWLVSEREIDRFCRDACRKEFHATSDEGKRKHRERQKDYRDREKEKGLVQWK